MYSCRWNDEIREIKMVAHQLLHCCFFFFYLLSNWENDMKISLTLSVNFFFQYKFTKLKRSLLYFTFFRHGPFSSFYFNVILVNVIVLLWSCIQFHFYEKMNKAYFRSCDERRVIKRKILVVILFLKCDYNQVCSSHFKATLHLYFFSHTHGFLLVLSSKKGDNVFPLTLIIQC